MWLPEFEPALSGDGELDRGLLVNGPISLEGVVAPRRRPVVFTLDPVLEEGDCGGVR